MPDPMVLATNLAQPVALRGDPAGTQLIVALRGGLLEGIDIATGQRTTLAQLPGRIATFALSPDGGTAFVAGSSIGLWQAPLDGSAPTRLIRSLRAPRAVVVDPLGRSVIVAEGGANGRLLLLDLGTNQLSLLESGLDRARGMVYELGAERLIVAENGSGRLVTPVAGSAPAVLVDDLGKPVDLAWHDPEQTHVLVADTAAGRVVSVDLRQPTNPPVWLASGLSQLRAAQPVGTETLAILTGATISLVTLPPVVHPPVELSIPLDELFIAGWVRARVIINDPAIAFDDIAFHVEPVEGGALVSNSRDNSFDPGAPTVVLSAGWRTGTHKLVAVNRIDGSELTRVPFDVIDTWTDPTLGPSIATFGAVVSGPDEGTWGGPDSGDFSVPQNVKVHPALGTRNVAVVLVETAEPNGQYPTGAALTTIIDDLRDELVDGVTVDGQTRSLVDYYAAASNGAFTVNIIGPVGPIALPNPWTSYFTMSGTRWLYREDVDSSVITEIVARNEAAAANGDPPFLDLSVVDSIMYVVCSAIATPPAADRFAWPRASRSKKLHTIGHLDLGVWGIPLSIPIQHEMARLFMPHDWAVRRGRRFHETAAHELGHNLGLRDQYNKSYVAAIADRITSQDPPGAPPLWTWELMAREDDLPLPSAAHRLMLGWLPPSAVKLFNFGTFGAADEEVTLRAVASGLPIPGTGEFAAIEVRLEDGRNYYFEYRPAVSGAIVDSNSPEAFAVLGTEALTRTPVPTDRAQILLVADDDDAVDEFGLLYSGTGLHRAGHLVARVRERIHRRYPQHHRNHCNRAGALCRRQQTRSWHDTLVTQQQLAKPGYRGGQPPKHGRSRSCQRSVGRARQLGARYGHQSRFERRPSGYRRLLCQGFHLWRWRGVESRRPHPRCSHRAAGDLRVPTNLASTPGLVPDRRAALQPARLFWRAIRAIFRSGDPSLGGDHREQRGPVQLHLDGFDQPLARHPGNHRHLGGQPLRRACADQLLDRPAASALPRLSRSPVGLPATR